MLLIVLIAILILVGFAYDWVRFQVTQERLIVSLELTRIAPLLKQIRKLGADLFSRERGFKEQEHRYR
jgi:hypothetical protein